MSAVLAASALPLLLLLPLLGGCTRPAEPPNLPPDFEGVVVGRMPRLDSPPTAPRLLLVERARTEGTEGMGPGAPARVDVEVGTGTLVLEALPEGGYRHAETSESWIGRPVRVWFAPGAARGGAPANRAVRLRPAVAIALESAY